MTRKTKTHRLSLRKPSDKAYRQVLVTTEDHGKIGPLADRIKAAHPDMEIDKVADVLAYCITVADQRLTEIEQGA